MKKTIYLMLALLMTSLMGANAQVRIGGDNNPNESAILDLNESDKQTDGTKGLALPRVALTNSTVWGLEGDTPIDGMTVYNTSTSKENGLQGEGVYTWTGGKTGEWKSPSLTRSSVTVVNGGAVIEGGEVIFFSKHTNAPAAFMMASPGEKKNKEDAKSWCTSQGYRLPHSTDVATYMPVSHQWAAFHATADPYANTTGAHHDNIFWTEDADTKNSAGLATWGQLSITDGLFRIITKYSNPWYSLSTFRVICIKDL